MKATPDILIYRASVDGASTTGDGTKKNPLISHVPSTIASPQSIGNPPDYIEIEEDGTLVCKGGATTWVDIDFPIIIRTTGPGIPVLSTVVGNLTAPQWAVNDYNMCEGQELIHQWKEGSTLYWHIHIITNGLDLTDRYLKWEVEWMWANPGSQVSGVQTAASADLLIPANTLDKTHLMFQLGLFTIPATIACHIWARLKRVSSTGAAPTNSPWCSMLQLHAEVDTLGSRTINIK